VIVGTLNEEWRAYAWLKTNGWKFELLMDDFTRPWKENDCRSSLLDWVVQGRKWVFLWRTLIRYLMELRKIFVRKFRAICTSLSDGIFCATISTIFIFLKGVKRGRETYSLNLRVQGTLVLYSKLRHKKSHLCEGKNTDILAWATTLSVISQSLYAGTQTQI